MLFFVSFLTAVAGVFVYFFFQAEDGIRDGRVTGVQTCALPIFVVGVERQRPRRRHLRETEVALAGEVAERMRDHLDLRKALGDRHGLVGAAAVDRSEERRVGKEWRSRRSASHEKKEA